MTQRLSEHAIGPMTRADAGPASGGIGAGAAGFGAGTLSAEMIGLRLCEMDAAIRGTSRAMETVTAEVQALSAKYDETIALLRQLVTVAQLSNEEQTKSRRGIGQLVGQSQQLVDHLRQQREAIGAVRDVVARRVEQVDALGTDAE